jgi:uncharacterized protein YicC (UPF0701 family)
MCVLIVSSQVICLENVQNLSSFEEEMTIEIQGQIDLSKRDLDKKKISDQTEISEQLKNQEKALMTRKIYGVQNLHGIRNQTEHQMLQETAVGLISHQFDKAIMNLCKKSPNGGLTLFTTNLNQGGELLNSQSTQKLKKKKRTVVGEHNENITY